MQNHSVNKNKINFVEFRRALGAASVSEVNASVGKDAPKPMLGLILHGIYSVFCPFGGLWGLKEIRKGFWKVIFDAFLAHLLSVEIGICIKLCDFCPYVYFSCFYFKKY